MMHIGAWEIGDDHSPRRLEVDREFLEKHLEGWIERDPSLLGRDIRWAARQLSLPDGSRLDLLGLTRDNTWVIAELKAGSVGSGTVNQAIHYFLQIAGMTNGELARSIRGRGISDNSVAAALDELAIDTEDAGRDYLLLVAGVGSGEFAETAASIMKRHGFEVPIQVVTFQLLRDTTGRRILLREVDEDTSRGQPATRERWTLDDLLGRTERHGVRAEFEQIRNELNARGYRTYQKKFGLNFNRGSRYQCFWVRPADGAIYIGYLSGNFPTLFGVDEVQAQIDLGQNWVTLPPADALARMRQWADVIDTYCGEPTEGAGSTDQPTPN